MLSLFQQILVHTFLPFPSPRWVREETRAIHQSAPPEPRVITHQIAHFLGDDASAAGYIEIPGCKKCSPGSRSDDWHRKATKTH